MALKQEEWTATAPAAHSVGLRKTYGTGQAVVQALAGVTVTFPRGRFTAVMGPSGSGKSTLMHCMAGLDRPTSGRSFVGGLDIGNLDDAGLTRLRRDRIGFVFQSFNLVPTLTAAENIIFADEPTGNLDFNSSAEVLRFLRCSVTELGQSIVMVTHDPRAAACADQVIFLADGAVVGALNRPTADSVLERMRTLGG
jgi:putative ABC transport system ATP-binding protein